jgi:serine/threonine protein kinase
VATGDKVAIKIVPVQSIKEATVECTAQGIMSHPNIVPLQETIVDLDGQRIFLVMELCRGGDLFDLVAEAGKLDESTARLYFRQMASALTECHVNGVYHRDLKPENILLDEHGNVKIADFGLAMMTRKDIRSTQTSHSLCGSTPYVAPEVLNSSADAQYSPAPADAWSIGIVLFIMLVGKQPFSVADAAKCNAYDAYLKDSATLLSSGGVLSDEAIELLKGLLNPDPELRLSMCEALASTWICGTIRTPQASKWCEVLGYSGKPKKDANQFASQDTNVTASTRYHSTSCHTSDDECSTEESTMLDSLGDDTDDETPCKSPSKQSVRSNLSEWSSPMQDDETANDMLVRTLGWVRLPAPKERLIELVTGVLEGLGVEYSIAHGELSDVVKVNVSPSDCDESPSRCDSPSSGSPSTRASSDDVPPDSQTHMAGQLSVQLEIAAPSPSRSDLHVKRHRGSVLRFHSFYHDFRNQLAGSTGWDEKAGRYLRISEAQTQGAGAGY